MKIVILEDNRIEYERIKQSLEDWVENYDIELSLLHFENAESFFNDPQNYSPNIDLFLLDIEMGNMNGIEAAKRLRLLDYKGDIIFLTAFKDFVFEGYNVHAFNYLLKPLNNDIFFRCLSEIEKKRHSNCYIYRNKQQITVSIPYHEIISFSVNRHYVDITTTKTVYTQYNNLNTIINSLPRQFVQVHRSYIINLSHVFKFSQNKIHLSNGSTVEVGRTYLKNFKTQYLQYTTRFNRNEEFQ